MELTTRRLILRPWKETDAICLKADNLAIGSIGLKLNGHTDMTEKDDECELGFWCGYTCAACA